MVFVVAEIGVNWDGNFELAKEMMENAKSAGCNAVKFQAFKEEIIQNHPEKDRLKKSIITKTNVEKIDTIAKTVGIEWFCTAMHPEVVEFLEPFIMKFKIREFDSKPIVTNKPSKLLSRILETGKEVIISSQEDPAKSKYFDNSQIRWLYCVPKYPCKFSEIDFQLLKNFDGYSNHCPDIEAPLTAVKMGAKIIEVHITSNKSSDFIDNNVSFDYKELKKLVHEIRLLEKSVDNK